MAKNTWSDIQNVALVPVPAATSSYCPVPQLDLLGEVTMSFRDRGYQIGTMTHKVHRNKPIFISQFDIVNEGMPESGRMKWSVALINSYNKAKAIRLVFGGHVFVCSNGMIVADHILRTKHTTNVWDRLPSLIDHAVGAYEQEVAKAARFYNSLRTQFTDGDRLASFAVNLARTNVLPKAKVMDFYDEAVKPSFEYETPEWCLYNVHAAYTHLAKEFNPMVRPNRVLQFEKALTQAYDLV